MNNKTIHLKVNKKKNNTKLSCANTANGSCIGELLVRIYTSWQQA